MIYHNLYPTSNKFNFLKKFNINKSDKWDQLDTFKLDKREESL